jgi:carbonic anhydrase
MIFSRVTFAYFLFIAAVPATEAQFSYDPNSAVGPQNWGTLDIAGNACEGTKNSPIAVETTSCDRFEDYVFSVSDSHFCNKGGQQNDSQHASHAFRIFLSWCIINAEW